MRAVKRRGFLHVIFIYERPTMYAFLFFNSIGGCKSMKKNEIRKKCTNY